MNSNNKKIVGMLIGITFIFIIILAYMNKIITSYLLIYSLLVLSIFLYVLAWIYISLRLFNDEKNFNRCSLAIYILYIAPLILILLLKWDGVQNKSIYAIISIMVIFICSLCLWVIYFACCIKVITDIKQDKFLFLLTVSKSILASLLVGFSGHIIILSHFGKNDDNTIVYQLFNIVINATYPFIDMYTYVRSKLNKHMKDNNIPIKIKSHSD